jgi:tetratricopeptide (TPR) repeat protein
MINPKISACARGSLILFIKGHLLEKSFDKTYFHYFDIEEKQIQSDLDLWEKTPISCFTNTDKIILLHHRGKKVISQTQAKSKQKKAVLLLEFLDWSESLLGPTSHKKNQQQSLSHTKLLHSISLWRAHTLFLLALEGHGQNQRKLIRIALEELKELAGCELSTHPYLYYLKGLLLVALNQWENATSHFHQAASYTHNPMLYKLLVNLYLHLDLPHVSAYFQAKLERKLIITKDAQKLAS